MYMQPTEAAAEPIVVTLTPPEIRAAAGAQPVDIIAEVKNAGTNIEQYTIEIENLDPSWYTIVVPSVQLFPGDSAPVPIRIHPPRGRDTRPGQHAFVVQARSKANPMMVGRTKGVVIVGSYSVFTMELDPKRLTARRGNYKVKLNNGADADLQIGLAAEDPDQELNFSFKNPNPTVSPNGRTVIPLGVKPRGLKLVGDEQKYKFTVTAHPVDGTDEDNKQMQAEFIHRPPFRAWKWPLVVLAALLLLLAFLIVKPDINPCSPTMFMFQGVPPKARFYYSLWCMRPDPVAKPAQPTPANGGSISEAEKNFVSGQGYKEIRATHGDEVGAPIENEWYDANGISHQRTVNGQLMYFVRQDSKVPSGTPYIYFIKSDGTVYAFVECDPPRQFFNCKMLEVRLPDTAQPNATPTSGP